MGIKFACELRSNNRLHFLDVCMNFDGDYFFWQHSPLSGKPVLDLASGHSSIAKGGIVLSCLRAALEETYMHKLGTCSRMQLERLKAVCHSMQFITSACENIAHIVKQGKCGRHPSVQNEGNNKLAVISYAQ